MKKKIVIFPWNTISLGYSCTKDLTKDPGQAESSAFSAGNSKEIFGSNIFDGPVSPRAHGKLDTLATGLGFTEGACC